MAKEKRTINGISAVVFSVEGGSRKFLILHRLLNWVGWEFPKGSIEAGEKPEEALLRELSEETGIKKVLSSKKLPVFLEFLDSVRKKKRVMQCFLVQTAAGEKVSLAQNYPQEHDAFEWAEEKTVLEKITFDDQKKVFRTALKALER